MIYMFRLCFDFIIQCIWFSFQGQLTMNLKHDVFFNGAIEVSQGFPLHVSNCTSVCSGEIGVGNGSGGVGNGDDVIQSKVGYNELANKDLGEDEELLQAKE
jgi:hypothetical protein